MSTRSETKAQRETRRRQYAASVPARQHHLAIAKARRKQNTRWLNSLQLYARLLESRVASLSSSLVTLQTHHRKLESDFKRATEILEGKATHPLLSQFQINVFANSDRCHQTLGMGRDALESLFQECKSNFSKYTQSATIRQSTPQRSSTTSDFDQLFIALLWMHQYPTMAFLESIFNISARTLRSIIKRVIIVLGQTIGSIITWPTDAVLETEMSSDPDLVVPGLENVACIVDGTRIRVARPKDTIIQRHFYSGKTKTHNQNILFVITRSGRCIYVSDPAPGRYNDQQLWNGSDLRARFIGKRYGIVGDKMFSFNRRIDKETIIGFSPLKKNQSQDLGDATKEEKNKQISRVRIPIEHYFAHLKQWRIFKGVNRIHSADLFESMEFGRIVVVVASLIEWLRIRSASL